MAYWLEDSISFLPVFLDEPYDIPNEIPSFDWWAQDQIQPYQAASEAPPATAAAVEQQPATAKSELPKKRKLPGNHFPSTAAQRRRTVISGNEEHGENEDDRKPHTGGGKKGHVGKGSCGNAAAAGGGGSREARWAEQLLNPLAAAIHTGNIYRVQHLLYVLQELASPAGDANHRLAFHGLQALTRRLPAGTAASAAGEAAPTYVTAEPRMFRSAVIKFHEVSPWFALPNCLANVAILQAAAATGGKNLHIVDAGVSHGVQWPTLLEALAQRAAGTVRLTVVGEGSGGPFGPAPAGYDCGPQLVRYAKSIELKLKVERGEVGGRRWAGDETVVVCVQFRAGRVGSGFWNVVREMEPDLVVVSEREEGQGMSGEFGRRAGVMWRFLESTAAAFKGRDCEERRVVEGEAARFLEEGGEGREKWKQRLEAAGFREEGFGEEAVEAGRALLRKFDGNWELRVAAAAAAVGGGGVGLWWKGQAVSSCSIWKPVRMAAAAFVNGYIYQEHC